MFPEPDCMAWTKKNGIFVLYSVENQQFSLRLGDWPGTALRGHGLAAQGPKGAVSISADLLTTCASAEELCSRKIQYRLFSYQKFSDSLVLHVLYHPDSPARKEQDQLSV